MQFEFKNLFGISKEDVKSTCVLMPFLTRPSMQRLGLKERFTGKPYACFQHEKFTLIETRMGPLFTGDAVLSLQNTPCEQIIFVGACGSLDEARCPIGSIVAPVACYAIESFYQMLKGDFTIANRIESSKNSILTCPADIEPVECASVGSILLEERYIEKFKDLGIDVLEMECGSVFAAAASIDRDAKALLYVTDIIGETSPYDINDDATIQSINRAQIHIIDTLLKLS